MSSGDYWYYITVEGVGKTSAVSASGDADKLWRFSTGSVPASVDTDGLVKPWWLRSGDDENPFQLPALTSRLDYRTGRLSVEGTTFRLQLVSGDSDVDLREIFLRPRHAGRLVGDLTASMSSTATTVELDSSATGLDDTEVGIQRERIILGTESGTPGTYTGCKRYVHGTPQTSYDVSRFGIDTEVYTSHHAITGRRVTLYALARGAADLTEEQVVWAGVLDECGYTDVTRLHLQCRGLTGLIANARLLPSPWTGTVVNVVSREVAGTTGTARLSVLADAEPGATVPRWPGSLPASPATTDFIYVRIKDSVYKAYWRQGSSVRPAGFFVPNLDAPEFDSPALGDGDVKEGDKASELFWVHPSAPAPAAAALDGLPLGYTTGRFTTAALQLLTSTEHGGNGSHDTGVDFGVRVPASMVDADSFDGIGYGLGERGILRRLFVTSSPDDEPEAALDWLERECKALQIGLTLTGDFKLGLARLEDLSDINTTELTFADGDFARDDEGGFIPVSVSAGVAGIIDEVAATYRRQPSGDGLDLSLHNATRRQRSVGPRASVSLDLGGVVSENKAFALGSEYLFRYMRPLPLVEFAVPLSQRVGLGKACKLTTAQIIAPDVSGDMVEGVTGMRCVIQEETLDLVAHRRHYKGILVGIGLRLGWIPPFWEVENASGTRVVNVYANVAQPATGGLYATDAAQATAGDVLRLLDQYGTQQATGLIVESVGSNQLTFTAASYSAAGSPTFSTGAFLIPANYDSQSATQQATWVSIADISGGLGSGPVVGFQYV